ncbi:TlpA family protein disulfide reductase [Ferruginibacter profundus]
MKNNIPLNLLSIVIGIAIDILLSFSRMWQNSFVSFSIYFFVSIATFLIVKNCFKKLNLFAVFTGMLPLELLGFFINPKAWLLLFCEIIIITAAFFLISRHSSLKIAQKVFYTIVIFFLILIVSFGVVPGLFLSNHTTSYSGDSTFFSKSIYSKIKFKTKAMNNVQLSAFDNKVVLFEFWFKDCMPCKIKEDALSKLAEFFKGDSSFQIVMINPGTINSFNEFSEYNFETSKLYSLYDSGGVLTDFYKIRHFPTEFLITRNGNIVHTFEGFIPNNDIIYLETMKNKISKCLHK